MLIDNDIGCKNIFEKPKINEKKRPNVQLLNQHIAGYLEDCEAYVQEKEDEKEREYGQRRRKLLKNKRKQKNAKPSKASKQKQAKSASKQPK